jgi:hypothetical protein
MDTESPPETARQLLPPRVAVPACDRLSSRHAFAGDSWGQAWLAAIAAKLECSCCGCVGGLSQHPHQGCQHEVPLVNVQLHVWLLCGAGAAAAGAGAADGGLPRIPLADVVVGPRLSAEGANGVVHSGVYRARSLHGVALAELALPVALKVRPVWEVHEALWGFVGT